MENRSGFPEFKSELNQKQFFFLIYWIRSKNDFFKNFFFQFKLIFLDSQNAKQEILNLNQYWIRSKKKILISIFTFNF